MKFHSAASDVESTSDALNSVIRELRTQLDTVDAAWVFFTAHHREHSDAVVKQISDELGCRALIGCSGEGVIGGDVEIERQPGIAVLAGQMPNVTLHPFHIATNEWQSLLGKAENFADELGCTDQTRAIIGFGDPWTTPLQQFMQALDMLAPRSPLIGGMASAARAQGQNVLVCNDETFDSGLVGMTLSGPIQVDTLVSQGARPVGQSFVITKGKDAVIEQLGGQPAMKVLREMFEQLPQRDRELMQNGLLIGRAISEYRETFGRGDFLVRNITGADDKSGAIAVTENIRVGQTVQFHVRDAETADEDLREMLKKSAESGSPVGGLLFSCNGRGTRLFDEMNHDIAVSRQLLAQTPFAGFFAAGEIGPIGGKNFIHGHTASFALLRDAVTT